MNNRDEINEQISRHQLFFYRDGQITVCLLIRNNQVCARGLTMCSPLDQFYWKVGRVKAYGMARRALFQQRNSGYIKARRFPEAVYPDIWQAWRRFEWKSFYMPAVRPEEARLLGHRISH